MASEAQAENEATQSLPTPENQKSQLFWVIAIDFLQPSAQFLALAHISMTT